MATVSGIVAVVFRVLYDQWVRLRAIRSRNHVVVLGGGPEAAQIAIRFREDKPVVCVGAATSEEQIELRAVRVRWMEAASEGQLRRILDHCVKVIITAPDDQEALVLGDGRLAAELAARIFEGWQQPGESITVHCGGPEAARAHFVERGLGFSESAASAALRQEDGPQGLGTLVWHELPAGTHLTPRVTRAVLSDWAASWLAYSKHGKHQTRPSTVYVAFDDDTVTLPVANAIKRSLGGDVEVVAVPKDDGLARHLRARGVICHPQAVMLCTPQELDRTLATELAEELVAELGRWPDDVPSLFGKVTRDADGLAVRADQADLVMAGVDAVSSQIDDVARLAGFGVVSAPLPLARVTVLTPTELATIADGLDRRIPASPSGVTAWERRMRLLELAGRLPALLNRAGRALTREDRGLDRIPPERLDDLAQLVHGGYREVAESTGNATKSEYAAMAYRRLPQLVRSSNVAQVLDIPVKLALLGLTLARRPEPGPAAGALGEHEFTSDEVELLAYQEHRRWAHFQIRNGRSEHNWNRPWDVLPHGVREYDRKAVRLIPRLLREVGLVMVADPERRETLPEPPVLKAAEGTYWRIGDVHARRLTEGRSWTTARGDELTAEAGDWWVRSVDPKRPDGRSVKPEAFERSYRQIEGDRYERTGSVRARQVLVPELVRTSERPAHADVHDWVITDDHGSTWPVSEESFERLYDSAPPKDESERAGQP